MAKMKIKKGDLVQVITGRSSDSDKAAARGLDKAVVRGLIQEHATIPGGPLTNAPIVNVLELNIALDALTKK